MGAFLLPVLAVMLLTDPSEVIDAAAAAAVSEDADRVKVRSEKTEVKSATIRSRTSDFDRKEGVVMFEGDVFVTYSDDYSMQSDQLYMFLSKSNEMSRVVAVGNVTISNETRTGTCALATYRRRKNEIEMFGDGTNVLARLVERGQDRSELEGDRIKFWLDTEQVEVERSRISVEQKGGLNVL